MIAAGDIVRITGRDRDYRVLSVSPWLEVDTYQVVLEGGGENLALYGVTEGKDDVAMDSSGNPIVMVSADPDRWHGSAPDKDGQAQLF